MKNRLNLSSASEKEGFVVLSKGWGNEMMVGVNGKKTSEGAQSIVRLREGRISIGYLAYPNPTLKNIIPDSRFYEYDSLSKLVTPTLLEGSKLAYKTSGRLEQSVSKVEYLKKIHQIKELLSAGEIYQINFSIRFRKKFQGNAFGLFQKLVEVNPTGFSAFLNCGNYQIISNSPERLFRVKGDKIITQPIKGTVAKLAAHSSQLKALLGSAKERAELDMITDLERNDVGKICKYGTLKLTKEREVLELNNLYHTYSEVQGKLAKDTKLSDIVQAMFPGGSITGCPKKRAMEYIEKLEGLPRNIFTGSILYLNKQVSDANICIRTALVKDGYIEYWAGGGIVADSDPESEYRECLLKAERFLGII